MRLRLVGGLLLGLLVLLAVWAGCGVLERQRQAGLIPAGLQAGAPVYANEVARGLGPGANEAGFLVYALPPDIATRIARDGLDWLDAPGFSQWGETPIPPDDQWDSVLCTGSACFSLAMYAQRYTFLDAPLSPSYLRMGDAAIARPGSVFAYGRSGLLVIDPEAGLAFLAYRG